MLNYYLLSQDLSQNCESLFREFETQFKAISFRTLDNLAACINAPVAGKLPNISVIVFPRGFRRDVEIFQRNHPYCIYIEVQEEPFSPIVYPCEMVMQLHLNGEVRTQSCSELFINSDNVSLSTSVTQVNDYLRELMNCIKPIDKQFYVTTQDYSFLNRLKEETELILGNEHPGAFAFERKNHTHEGVDIYASENDAVYAIHEGTIIAIRPFTGEHTSLVGITPSPWWNNTFCVLVQTKFGVINYGEITPIDSIRVGDRIQKGALLGRVCRVLKTDKGRPLDMVHLERYTYDTDTPVVEWSKGEVKPPRLLAPGNLLLGLCLKDK